jgi:polyhydroxyalkanoate synthase
MHWWFEAMDAERRVRGNVMDGLGLGPRESESEVVLALPGLRLRCYGGPAHARTGLIVPAPIKRHYIWDLLPGCSVVQRMLDDGMRVYLIEWADPEHELVHAGLDQYGDAWIGRCIEVIRRDSPSSPIFMFSHSLGGVLAVIHAALRPQQVAGLVLIETPLHFGPASGAFFPLLVVAPAADTITRAPPLAAGGARRVPGSLLSMISAAASPTTFQVERAADFVASLGSRTALLRHVLVERWTLDELPMAARLFEQVVETLYRRDALMRGMLKVGGQALGPDRLESPLLAVYDPQSRIIPPPAISAFIAAAGSRDKQLLPVTPEAAVGLSHVAALVGTRAHRELWPRLLAWTRSRSQGAFRQ